MNNNMSYGEKSIEKITLYCHITLNGLQNSVYYAKIIKNHESAELFAVKRQ